ncbi:MAG: polyprenyl synthetase family protein [Candidatus Omnitrophota bacterium]
MDIKAYLKKRKTMIGNELERLIPPLAGCPHDIHKAMKYALKGGKRIRPILCMASACSCGANAQAALKTACAIEMIHAYSLIHDDLPSMDNDGYRRGKLSCHRKFGVANAILAGDALLTLTFNVLSGATPSPSLNTRIIKELSQSAGTFGMIGGQAVDISSKKKDLFTLEYINIHKTGALIASSCKIGAIASGARKKDIESLHRFGEYIGLVFQIVDDMLDGEGMLNLLGPKRAYERAAELTAKAKRCVSYLGRDANPLCSIADFMLDRKI